MKGSEQRIIVGITGATGIQYGLRALELLHADGRWEVHLVITRAAELVAREELGMEGPEGAASGEAFLARARNLADFVWNPEDFAAPIASGSFDTVGMLVAPCTVRTLSEIASGVTTTLVSRAADVVLKERRRLVLLVRETPLHLGHLRSMVAVTEAGGIVMPPAPAFYTHPSSLDDVVTATVERALKLILPPAAVIRQ